MASLSGVSSSNTLSSLMNSANMISGLASGLDTEGMIESLVKSYQTKIGQLNQKITKVEWKQDIYRSIISQMVGFSNKYASYTSNTNLMSTSFFSNAVKVSALGKYADAVSASGKTGSSISLNAVHQLATSAQYRTASNLISGDGSSIEASKGIDLNGTTTLASLDGSLTLTYGSQTLSVSFDQVADVKAMDEIRARLGGRAGDAEVLAELINQKLAGQTINLTGGGTADAADRIQVTAQNGTITFSDKSTAGNSVYISGASSDLAGALGISDALDNGVRTGSIAVPGSLTYEMDNAEYLSGKTMNISLDGVVKSVALPTIVGNRILDADGNMIAYNAANYTKSLNDAIQKAFNGKITVSNAATDGSLQLRFDVQKGSNLILNTDVGDALGIGEIATSYLNTNKTLGELMGDKLEGLTPNGKQDADGNDLYDFVLNGVKVGSYSRNSTLAELMNDINKSGAGVKVSYSQTTKKFLFESTETGAGSEIKLGGGLAEAMFGTTYGSEKITDMLGKDTISRETSFQIGDDTFTVKFESNSETMDDLLKKLNAQLKGKGYEASYNVREGLVIKKGEDTVDLTYVDDDSGNNMLRDIIEKTRPEPPVQNHLNRKLTEIVGRESIKGSEFSFTIDGIEYEGSILKDTGTLNDLVKKLNTETFKNKEHYAYYDEERGLYFKDKYGNEVNVEYGNDLLGDVAEAVKVQDHSKDSLADLLGKDIVNVQEYQFTVGNKTFGIKIDSNDMTMDGLLETINDRLKGSGYTASYSAMNGGLIVTDSKGNEANVGYVKDNKDGEAGETSALEKIMGAYVDKFKEGSGSTYSKGQDAIFDVTVNGETMQMTRSSNTVDIDGLTITMKDVFNSMVDEKGNQVKDKDGNYQVDNKLESVTFKSSTDSDKIIDAIKAMVNDYNTMMAEIKSAYMTMPYRGSNGAFSNYEPLTDEDREGMSESAIERYEEKARQGILFGDRTLSTLYTKLNQAFSFSSRADVDALKDMGISVTYNVSDGSQAVTIDEEKLRAMLDSDPDRVADLFTKSDGIMDRMKTQLDNYAKTTGEPKGILIQQAGSPLSSLSLLNNQWQSEIDNYTKQIERWQSKLESQVERYTSQFTRLEQLVAQMNNQSSTLAGLMGGG